MHNVPPPPPPFITSSSPKSLPPDRLFFDQIGMHDIHSLLGDAASASAAASGGLRVFGDRRMRAAPHSHHNNLHHQALKCPRCDSLNTKFCYYNNYNLSQPRHYCKNCRRYWTKGGVLRNVPVGGGCRKSKRSSKRSKKPSPDSPPPILRSSISNSNSSTESAAPILPPMPVSAIGIGSFVGLLEETTPFGMEQQNQVSNCNPFVFDRSGHVDPGVSGGGGGHLGVFDLTPGSDWSQSSQWHESDHHLYLPP